MTDEPTAPVPMSSEPIRVLHLPYESARRLAMLPRIKYYNESTAAALAGMIAALPSATDAVLQTAKHKPFSLELFDTIQVMICFGFLVWLFVSVMYSRQEKTSTEFLNELYGPSGSAISGQKL